ncbi:hypothetical protein AB0J74_33115 [Asanoa sp. NPDC049573]|uniref:hypothetical protein n=1 Tax=Asanoa sp. NPDC049573 TaxID=3155396 RepID=UPI00341E5F83
MNRPKNTTNADPSGQIPSHGDLRLQTIAALCSTGSCPTIYRSDRGTVVVQGYAVTAERAGMVLPEGELLVEIPAELLANVARTVS